jgi:hypothetical protein
MTLAELFLLILFVVWYGVNPSPPKPPDEQVRLRDRIEKLEREKWSLQAKLDDIQRRLEYWRRTFNRDLPGSDQEMREVIREYFGSHPGEAKTLLADLGRDYPPCLPEPRGNTLLYVEVINGSTQVEVLREPVTLNETLRASGVAPIIKGQVVTDSDRIDALLASSTKGMILRNDKAVSCRFDYSLAYGSAEDYLRARTKFEKYLYPARLTPTRQ